MDLDDLLDKLGGFGRYQRRLYLALCLVSVGAAMHNMGYVFWGAKPEHHCAVPDTPQLLNVSMVTIRNVSVPLEMTSDGQEVPSSCKLYDLDYAHLNTTDLDDLLTSNRSAVPLMTCASWKYDQSVYKSTIVTKWDLVCEWHLLQSTSQSVYMAGRIFGCFMFGHISDHLGRRNTVLLTTLSIFVFSTLAAVTPEFYSFLVFRFLTAIAETGQFQTAFIMVMEIVGPSWRVLSGTLYMVFWALGYLILAMLAYFIRHAIWLQLTIALPTMFLAVYYWILPESARWLLVKGRTKEAMEILQRLAKVNGTSLDPKQTITVKHETRRKVSFVDLFRTSYLRKTTLALFYIWMVDAMVYFGLSLNTSNFGGNAFINFSIAGAVEIPGYLLGYVCMQHFGRRLPQAGSMILAGVALLATLPVPKELYQVTLTLAMVGKFAVTAAFGMIYIYTSELYPTTVRSIAVGCCAFMCRVSSVVAPFTGHMDTLYPGLSLILFGVTSVGAGVVILLLPETKGKCLPATIEEAENLFSRPCKVTNNLHEPTELRDTLLNGKSAPSIENCREIMPSAGNGKAALVNSV